MIAKAQVTDMEASAPRPAERAGSDHSGERPHPGYGAPGFGAGGFGPDEYGSAGLGAGFEFLSRAPAAPQPAPRPPRGRRANGHAHANGHASGQMGGPLGAHPGLDACGPLLAQVIASKILPRLVLAHRQENPVAAAAPSRVTPGDVLMLGELVLMGELDPALSHVAAVIERGVPPESIYLDLLGPTAARLGELWCEDTISFAEVTIGQVGLQRLMRSYSDQFLRDCPEANPRRRILLSPLPGEQHAFGHFIVCDFFRRAGWMVTGDPFATQTGLLRAVRESWFEVIGLSVSCAERLRELGTLVREIRAMARNPGIAIMVGGAPFSAQPALAWQVGADASAVDARQAPVQAEALLGMLDASAGRRCT